MSALLWRVLEDEMALKDISKRVAEDLQNWLHEDKVSAREDDPSVGIFADDELAEGFELLQSIIEEETGVPAP